MPVCFDDNSVNKVDFFLEQEVQIEISTIPNNNLKIIQPWFKNIRVNLIR